MERHPAHAASAPAAAGQDHGRADGPRRHVARERRAAPPQLEDLAGLYLWSMVYGLWSMVYGPCHMVHALWSMASSRACGPECACRHTGAGTQEQSHVCLQPHVCACEDLSGSGGGERLQPPQPPAQIRSRTHSRRRRRRRRR
jgi:hypothetical protein